MDYLKKFPHIDHFFSCYLHEDFIEEHEGPEQAVAAFLQEEGVESIKNTLAEQKKLLSLGLSEENLNQAISQLGSSYYFQADGYSPQKWLKHLIKKFEAHLNR